MDSPKSLQSNPFQKSGKLKKKNSFDNRGRIFTKHHVGGKLVTVPVLKDNGEQWTRDDRNSNDPIQRQVIDSLDNLNLKKLLKACDIMKVSKWGKGKDGVNYKLNNEQLVSALKKAYLKERRLNMKNKLEKFISYING
ncbi:MAG TPA: hypothetical protein QF753_01305 [Victivallales bacterium]|nr:hypothetical protein [Victivallales bacterium]|tara:strand:+ start:112 stop:525 length:414 start_codon:yes stop_codon:yes gene_type:complete